MRPPSPGSYVLEGLHVCGTFFGLSIAFAHLRCMLPRPSPWRAAEVLQGPTSTYAAHSTSSLGRSQEETSCSGAADSVMLGYANLAKAWSVAHNGGERVDPILGMIAQARRASQKTNWREGQCSPAQAAAEEA